MRSTISNIHSRAFPLLLCICILVTSLCIPIQSTALTAPSQGYKEGDIVDGNILLMSVGDMGYWEPAYISVYDKEADKRMEYPLNYDLYRQYQIVTYGTIDDIRDINNRKGNFMVTDSATHGYVGYFTNETGQRGEYQYIGYTKKGDLITNDRWFRDASRFGTSFNEDYTVLYSITDGNPHSIATWKDKPAPIANTSWGLFDTECIVNGTFDITPKVRQLLTTNFFDSDHPSALKSGSQDTGYSLATLFHRKPLEEITDADLLEIMPYCKVMGQDGGAMSRVAVRLDYRLNSGAGYYNTVHVPFTNLNNLMVSYGSTNANQKVIQGDSITISFLAVGYLDDGVSCDVPIRITVTGNQPTMAGGKSYSDLRFQYTNPLGGAESERNSPVHEHTLIFSSVTERTVVEIEINPASAGRHEFPELTYSDNKLRFTIEPEPEPELDETSPIPADEEYELKEWYLIQYFPSKTEPFESFTARAPKQPDDGGESWGLSSISYTEGSTASSAKTFRGVSFNSHYDSKSECDHYDHIRVWVSNEDHPDGGDYDERKVYSHTTHSWTFRDYYKYIFQNHEEYEVALYNTIPTLITDRIRNNRQVSSSLTDLQFPGVDSELRFSRAPYGDLPTLASWKNIKVEGFYQGVLPSSRRQPSGEVYGILGLSEAINEVHWLKDWERGIEQDEYLTIPNMNASLSPLPFARVLNSICVYTGKPLPPSGTVKKETKTLPNGLLYNVTKSNMKFYPEVPMWYNNMSTDDHIAYVVSQHRREVKPISTYTITYNPNAKTKVTAPFVKDKKALTLFNSKGKAYDQLGVLNQGSAVTVDNGSTLTFTLKSYHLRVKPAYNEVWGNPADDSKTLHENYVNSFVNTIKPIPFQYYNHDTGQNLTGILLKNQKLWNYTGTTTVNRGTTTNKNYDVDMVGHNLTTSLDSNIVAEMELRDRLYNAMEHGGGDEGWYNEQTTETLEVVEYTTTVTVRKNKETFKIPIGDEKFGPAPKSVLTRYSKGYNSGIVYDLKNNPIYLKQGNLIVKAPSPLTISVGGTPMPVYFDYRDLRYWANWVVPDATVNDLYN